MREDLKRRREKSMVCKGLCSRLIPLGYAPPVGLTLHHSAIMSSSLLDFLDTWVAGGLGPGGLGLGVGLGLPQAPQSPCEFVSVGHVWTPISSSACSVCSFLFFFTSINIFCFQHSLTIVQQQAVAISGQTQLSRALLTPPVSISNDQALLRTPYSQPESNTSNIACPECNYACAR
jgi:hypothetical protein